MPHSAAAERAAYGVAYLLSGRQFSLQKCDFVFCGKGEKSPVASKYCGKPLRGCVGSRSAAGAAAPRLVGARIQCILKNADFPTWCHCEVRPWRLRDAWATGDVGAGWEVLLARPMRVGTVLIGEVAVENCFLKKGLDGSAASIP